MYPKDYLYSKDHEWLLVSDAIATIGITYHAQDELGEIVYVELPEIGEKFEINAEFGSVESVKAVAEIYTPISGEVVEINSSLDDAPEKVNDEPHEGGWLIKLKIANPEELDNLMTSVQYEEFVSEESK